jgi:hypothetical protein
MHDTNTRELLVEIRDNFHKVMGNVGSIALEYMWEF